MNGWKAIGPLGLPIPKPCFVAALIYQPYPNISETLMIRLIKMPVYTIILSIIFNSKPSVGIEPRFVVIKPSPNFVTVDHTNCISHYIKWLKRCDFFECPKSDGGNNCALQYAFFVTVVNF